MGKQFTFYSAEAYSEHCQASKMKIIIFNRQLFSQKSPFWMFDKVLNTPVFSKL